MKLKVDLVHPQWYQAKKLQPLKKTRTIQSGLKKPDNTIQEMQSIQIASWINQMNIGMGCNEWTDGPKSKNEERN